MSGISGVVAAGLGEGRLFMSINHYKSQIAEKLGFAPFEGTLNIKVNEKEKGEFFKNGRKIILEGFKTGDKSFGHVCCILSEMGGIKGASISPEKASHKNIIEFIAPMNLRKELGLKDGDKVTIRATDA